MGVINLVIFIDDVPMNNVQIARNLVMDLEIAVYVFLPSSSSSLRPPFPNRTNIC